MAEYTKNLNLEKPDYGEYYDIGTFNANADKIDKGIEDSENRSTQRLEVHKDSNDHTADKIRYDGKIPKDNVKDALDETDTRIDNIVSQGGSDNTEVVDARHSTTKGKTYDTLKGRLEDGEQDIEKLKTDTNVAESVTETSYDSVISVPGSAVNGQVSGVVKGLTATNLVKNGDFRDGKEGWEFRGSDRFEVVDGNMVLDYRGLEGGAGFRHIFQKPPYVVGNKYYAKVDVKKDGSTGDILFLGCPTNPTANYPDIKIAHFSSAPNNTLLSISGVFTIEEPDCYIGIFSKKATDGDINYLTIYNMVLIDLTQTFGAGNEPTKEECDQIFANYFDDTKSTIGSARVKSVGKNLFNLYDILSREGMLEGEPSKTKYTILSPTSIRMETTSDRFWQNRIYEVTLKPNTQYHLKIGEKEEYKVDNSNRHHRIRLVTDTTDSEGKLLIRFSDESLDGGGIGMVSIIKDIQLEEGKTATEYEPYIEDRAYVTAVKDNKIVNLKSLPNGVADEIDLEQGKMIKRVSQYVLKEEDLVLDKYGSEIVDIVRFSNIQDNKLWDKPTTGETILTGFTERPFTSYKNLTIDDIGKYYTWDDHCISFFVQKNKYATISDVMRDFAGTELIYQLAEPEIIPIRWTGLQAYEGGTVYVDTVIPELGFYYDNGLGSHYPDHPIKEVDTLYRVDKETGYREPLDVSKCEIREDRLSFTHPDLVDGDLCDWDYVPMTESTRPETTFEFPTNLKASVNSLLDAEQINKKEHNIFKVRLDNHDRDIITMTDIQNMHSDSIQGLIDDVSQLEASVGRNTQSIDTLSSTVMTHLAESVTIWEELSFSTYFEPTHPTRNFLAYNPLTGLVELSVSIKRLRSDMVGGHWYGLGYIVPYKPKGLIQFPGILETSSDSPVKEIIKCKITASSGEVEVMLNEDTPMSSVQLRLHCTYYSGE